MEIIDQLSNLSLEEDEIQTHETLIVQWKSEKVYEEVPDQAQNCISLRWVIKEKLVDNEKFTKARLCARDFKEE